MPSRYDAELKAKAVRLLREHPLARPGALPARSPRPHPRLYPGADKPALLVALADAVHCDTGPQRTAPPGVLALPATP
ncbi:hypothetical protein PJK45_04495 [Mycobacterium kansasii]|uniref:Uncharacterized protein n=2 Tax=Mycobacterium kansasii TaxID=1768 RepID=A0A653F1S1_MYCKA|nr:hypothetical protein [Mycobacterium kansasii]ETZ98377.1 hypothetical protein I547_6440 [Mycobacterium kansasii 824]EUA16793.1 hypothetical protein I545_3816 [Mycobacterium kansasii 662]KEP41790.1 hypothetical protein MKSMC1_30550 [Mycobacterium kansasii]MXO38608.1 hypothetical protein [Mycobacterium kansasii]UCA19469.1 hypothetical protein LA359_25870 [Mycobacterium kansasii]